MARHTHRLTDIKAKALKKAGLYADGNGLYLRVATGGTKSWIFRYSSGGRLRDMGLGKFPTISLATAREQAAEAHAMLARGDDPIDARRAKEAAQVQDEHVATFEEAAARYMAAHEAAWQSGRHRQQWRNTLAVYAGPVIGTKNVAAVTTDDVLRILEPIWTDKPETAGRVRARIESVLDWAKVRGLRDGENPARWRGHLNHLLPSHTKTHTVRRHPAMPWQDIPKFMTELRANSSIVARALEMTILTAVRTSECIDAVWSEFHLNAEVWVIPAPRMKMKREHRVPLTGAVLALVRDLSRRPDCQFVFPCATRPDRPLSDMAMLKLLYAMRSGLTVHGFRSTFRDWAAECTSFPREVIEMALAHAIGNKTEEAYWRSDLFDKRRKLMEAWAAYCGRDINAQGEVLPLTRAATA